jgi:hypothetical protein
VIRKALDDGWTYYGRVLESPWAALDHRRTRHPDDPLTAVTASPTTCTIAAHKSLLAKRRIAVDRPCSAATGLRLSREQAIWDDAIIARLSISMTTRGRTTPEECEAVEVAATEYWMPDPDHSFPRWRWR